MAFNIGAVISVGGEKEYLKTMANIREEMKYVKAEAAAVTSAYGKNEKSIESLTDANRVLAKAEKTQLDAVKATEDALQRMRDNGVEPTSAAYKRMDANLNNAKAALNETQREIRENANALNEMRIQTDEAASGVVDFQNKQDDGKVLDYRNAINKLSEIFGIRLPAGIVDTINGLADFDTKVDDTKNASSAGFTSVVNAIGNIDPAAVGAVAAVGTIGAAIAKMAFESELELDGLSAKLQTALGLTDSESRNLENTINSVYIASTENREQAEQAIAAVMKIMGASESQAAEYAIQLANINNVWGKDFSETARTASTLMKTFGISGQEALDIITSGLQTSADKNGDLLDVLNEYSPSFKRLGDDADEFLSRLVAGTEAGAFSADKAADVYKEIFVKAAEGNADFLSAVDDLGLSSKKITSDLLSGDERAQKAIEVLIGRLDAVRNTTEQNRIASKLLGTQWEDVGTDAVVAMSNVTGQIENTTNASIKALINMFDTVEGRWDRLWKGLRADAGDIFKGPFWGAIDSAGETIETFKAFFNSIGQNANGTEYWRGGPTWVGERGPEIIVPPMGSRIIPNAQSEAMARNASGIQASGGNTYYVTIDAKNVREFNDIVRISQQARQNARAGR